MKSQNRLAAYDVMRIVAIVAVLLNHLPAYHLFHNGRGMMLVWGLAIGVVVRIGVPLFAMVSGALLLGRNETYRELWQKRISRMLLVVLIFEGIHYACGCLAGQEQFDASDFAYGLFSGRLKGMTSYWFLYAYLGFLVMLPFMRRVAQAMTRADFLWLMGAHVVCTTLPVAINFACECAGAQKFVISSAFVVSLSSVMLYFYPLIGFWIDRNVDVNRITRRQWLLILGVTLAGLVLSAWMTWYHNDRFHDASETYINLTVFCTAIAVFLAAKRIFDGGFALRRPRLNRALCLCGSLVFGVYLLDQPLKFFLYEPLRARLFIPSPFEAYGLSSAVCFSLIWVCITLVLCGGVTWLLKRLPLFHKLV